MQKGGTVYILSNQNNTVLYVGVTSDLRVRLYQHQNKMNPASFTAKYNCNKLVFFQSFMTIDEAILFEKKLKAGSRNKKIELIERMNAGWKDLSDLL